MASKPTLQSGLPVSIGVDLVEVRRFAKLPKNSKFLADTFTARELADCKKKQSRNESLAARFAAKEAVRKSIKENVRFNRIEIKSSKDGAPEVSFLDAKLNSKYRVIMSMTHTTEYAQAACVTFTTV